MKIKHNAALPAGAEDVFAIIATQEYQNEKVSTQARRSSASVVQHVGGRVAVHTERTISTRSMPPAVVSVAGDHLTITEEQSWHPPGADGARHADLKITVSGVPIRLIGTISLSATGAGSSLTVQGDLICSIPLVGRKVEQAAAPTIEGSIDLEARLLRERLS